MLITDSSALGVCYGFAEGIWQALCQTSK